MLCARYMTQLLAGPLSTCHPPTHHIPTPAAGYGPSGATINDSAGVKRVADEVRGSPAPPAGNARLSRPLVRDSLGQLRPMAVNQTGAAGGGEKRGVKMAKKAAGKAGEIVDSVSSN